MADMGVTVLERIEGKDSREDIVAAMESSDRIILFWSHAAAADPSVSRQIQIALDVEEKHNREFIHITRLSRRISALTLRNTVQYPPRSAQRHSPHDSSAVNTTETSHHTHTHHRVHPIQGQIRVRRTVLCEKH